MNSILVYRGHSAYLIDPGVLPPEISEIKNFINEKQLTEVKIIMTHTHGDHISGWTAFKSYSTFSHYSSVRKSKAVKDHEVKYLRGIYRKMGYQVVDQLQFPTGVRVLEETRLYEWLPYSFKIFHCPGHSRDMSVILFSEQKLIITGDMLIESTIPFILNSISKYLYSLNRIKEIVLQEDIQIAIPGHGKIAEKQSEILKRLDQEARYINHLLRSGSMALEQELRQNSLADYLYKMSPIYEDLHAHHVNVQTFLREMGNLMGNDIKNKL